MYLKNLNLGMKKEYVSNLIYINTVTDYCMDVDAHPSCKHFLVSGLKSTINVYPFVFENDFVQTETDFLSILFDHECFHAMEYYQNPKLIVPAKNIIPIERVNFFINLELRAYNNQMQAIKNGRNVSARFLSNLEARIKNKNELKSSLEREDIIFSIA